MWLIGPNRPDGSAKPEFFNRIGRLTTVAPKEPVIGTQSGHWRSRAWGGCHSGQCFPGTCSVGEAIHDPSPPRVAQGSCRLRIETRSVKACRHEPSAPRACGRRPMRVPLQMPLRRLCGKPSRKTTVALGFKLAKHRRDEVDEQPYACDPPMVQPVQ